MKISVLTEISKVKKKKIDENIDIDKISKEIMNIY